MTTTMDDPHLLAATLQALPLGVVVSGADGRTIYANPAAEPTPGRDVETGALTIVHDGSDYKVTTYRDVTEQRRFENELFERAYMDEMTGLPNRHLLEQTVANLSGLRGDMPPFALAFVDIDNFKHINDYYGHAAGDGFLLKMAQRISAEIRPSDVLARVGGDEFVLLLSPLPTAPQLHVHLTRLIERLKDPVFIDGYEIFSSASIGVTLYPAHGCDYEALRLNADLAMHRVKSSVKGEFLMFEPSLGAIASERMQQEQRLRLAIRDRRLCCAFQPKVDFRLNTVVGLEVLLRLRDEQGIMHAPGSFLHLAVELGLMDEITLMVLSETVSKIDWINETFGPQTSISVNVAAKQAGDLKFMTTFAAALADTGYPERFMVELTEEAFLAKGDFQTSILPMLRRIGARVSIDDFGVGYSSLSALAEITADEIKVDRSFITDIHNRPRNQSILRVIETLGSSLGMSVIVEGVETYEELAYIAAATRIRCAQGYYFSKPVMMNDPEPASWPDSSGRAAHQSREFGGNRTRRANRA